MSTLGWNPAFNSEAGEGIVGRGGYRGGECLVDMNTFKYGRLTAYSVPIPGGDYVNEDVNVLLHPYVQSESDPANSFTLPFTTSRPLASPSRTSTVE